MLDLIVRTDYSVLERTFAGENIALMVTETRQEFGHLNPQLLYIGGKHPFTEFLVFTAMLLAFYRVSKAHGRTVVQTGELV